MSFALILKELWSNWKSPWGYLKATGFLLLSGYFFVSLMESYNDRVSQFASSQLVVDVGVVSLREWVIRPYYEALVFFLLFFAPLGSMGMIADEIRAGTFFRLSLSPLSSFSIVLAKFTACFIELFFWMVLVSLPAVTLCLLEGESILPCLLGALAFLLAGAAFLAWGLACSGAIRNSVGAVATSVGTLFLLYFSHSFFSSEGSSLLTWISPAQQSNAILEGLIQPVNIGYFIALIVGAFAMAVSVVRFEREG